MRIRFESVGVEFTLWELASALIRASIITAGIFALFAAAAVIGG